jgi:Leucine Rich repeat
MLSVLGAFLTILGLVAGGARPPSIELFPKVEGISDADMHLLDEVKKLGGKAHFMERTPRFLGRFGGHDLLAFSFQGKAFDDAALARFVKTYGDSVWGLYLSNTGITDEGLRHLAGLAHIKNLEIGNADPHHAMPGTRSPLNTVTDAGLVHLKGLTTLKHLNLGGLPITDAGLDAVKDLPNLGGLYLDRTQIRGSGIGRLKSLPGLAVLYLDGSSVTDEGLTHLRGATNLQWLSLPGIPLTGQGLTHLKALPKLNHLNLQGCGLTSEDLNDFQAARPSVTLE